MRDAGNIPFTGAGPGGRRGEACPQRVAAEPGGVKADRFDAALYDEGDGPI